MNTITTDNYVGPTQAGGILAKGRCYFRHIVGRPLKNGHDVAVMTISDKNTIQSTANHKHTFIKKK
jgi:hypothetical protein